MIINNEKKVLGWIFIVLGFLILITPFTPGSVLLLIGLHMVYGEKYRLMGWKDIKNYLRR
jgi:hypothetical protein